ncbi:MAG TPA: exodeoxyribonuclease VII small subunit [Clostridia bacterium]|nr:exodeoxyribonuclease VII small subunit [Clostridia bacterium]
MTDKKDISLLKFEEAMIELEDIIKKLEGRNDNLMLEESVDLYKRGTLLSKHCKTMLQNAQQEVNILTKNQDGELQEISFVEKENGTSHV